MSGLDALLGHVEVVQELQRVLRDSDTKVVRLTGPAGSGKTYVACQVAKEWLDEGDRVIVAMGDDGYSNRSLYPFLTGLAKAPLRWADLANQGGRSAAQVVDGVVPSAGAATSLFDLLTSVFRQRSERALMPYSTMERQVISDLRRMARSRRLLLVADNAHWWDADSLWLLLEVLSQRLRAEIPNLGRIAVLLVDTASEQRIAAPEQFAAAAKLAGPHVFRMARCTRSQLPEVIVKFGYHGTLVPEMLDGLFAATNGHLKLLEQVAAYLTVDGTDDLLDGTPGYLQRLLSARLNALGPDGAKLHGLLTKAAIIGLAFDERELRCLAGPDAEKIPELMRQAAEISLVSAATGQFVFAHDIVRSGILGMEAASQVREHQKKFEECLARLRPGDYAARAGLLLQAGEVDRGRSLLALAAVELLRQGVPGKRVLDYATSRLPEDLEIRDYLELMIEGYESVANGEFEVLLPRLRTPVPSESVVMAAERNYLAALCLMEQQTIEKAVEAEIVLQQWERSVRHEPELMVRMLLLRQQAEVIAERYEAARNTGIQVERRLHSRARFDGHAAVALQIQNRRAGSVSPAEIAEVAITEAVRFFERKMSERNPDRIELYRSLNNLAAIQLRLSKHAEAFATARKCEELALTSPDSLPRLDVLASNLVLAGLRSGAIAVEEAVAHQQLLVTSSEGAQDKFLHRCNLAAFQLLAGDDAAANETLAGLAGELREKSINEGYLVYYAGVLDVGAAVLQGEVDRALERHLEIQRFVRRLNWPGAPYVRRRMELLPALLDAVDPTDRQAADEVLLRVNPQEIGPAWPYYGRLLPCAELSFWSDS